MIVSLKGHIYDNAKDQAPREKRIFFWYPQKSKRYNPSFQPVAREIKELTLHYRQQPNPTLGYVSSTR